MANGELREKNGEVRVLKLKRAGYRSFFDIEMGENRCIRHVVFWLHAPLAERKRG